MTKRVAIIQSNYVPWRGYFDLVGSVDELVLLDDAQYTRRDWRNRNRIKTAAGVRWLTIAVDTSGGSRRPIHDIRIADREWAADHWRTLRQAYAAAPAFTAASGFVEELYRTAPTDLLSDVNAHFTAAICERLGIATAITPSSAYAPQGSRTDRLVDICVKAGADVYVSGPSARAYLDEGAFARHGIGVSWFAYGPYPEYDQPHPPFEPGVSILDLLLCTGDGATALIRPIESAAR